MTTGELIREARKKAGLTQAQLAEKLNIPYQSISQWERGLRRPKVNTLYRIAAALGTNIESFYTDSEREISIWSNFEGWTRACDHYDHKTSGFDYAFSATEKKLILAFSSLNDEGQEKAVERVQELTEIPRYQRTPEPPETHTEPPEGQGGHSGE